MLGKYRDFHTVSNRADIRSLNGNDHAHSGILTRPFHDLCNFKSVLSGSLLVCFNIYDYRRSFHDV